MKAILKLTTLLIFFSSVVQAQDCTCEDNFNWVKKTFEENDAGFAYALEKKGEGAYQKHNEVVIEKVKQIKDGGSVECTQILFQWLRFFRSGHIGISRLNNNQNNNASTNRESDEAIIQKYKDWEKVNVDLDQFYANLKKTTKPGFEGVWESGVYKIGIQKQGDQYIGFIIEADGVYWQKDQLKLKIDASTTQPTATYYMRNHSAEEFDEVNLWGKNYLQMGTVMLKRSAPDLGLDKGVERFFRFVDAEKPFFEEISKNTVAIRIPSFSYSEKKFIDSVIAANREKILKTENLIIDIRYNGGGSDASYNELIPFLYTNPIRIVGMQMYSTPLNNRRMLEFSQREDFPEDERTLCKKRYEILNQHLGEFVNVNDGQIVEVQKMEKIHEYPKNVSILINQSNGSTAEQFLLAAKQSKKVKLFGTTTYGVLDISNMYFVKNPCKQFELGYCLSKSYRIPDMAIDDKGIQPDYYIDNSVPEYKWIDFVLGALNDQ